MSEFAPSRFQLLKDFWTDIKFAINDAIKDEGTANKVLATVRKAFCDRLFPTD